MTQKFDGKGNVLCDTKGCKKRATVNHQSGTITWTIDDIGYRYEEFYADGDENIHACDDHAND